MGLLILAKFNSMLPLGILFINPSFSILSAFPLIAVRKRQRRD